MDTTILVKVDPARGAHYPIRVFAGPDREHVAHLGTLVGRKDESLALATVFAAAQAYGLTHGTVIVEGMGHLAASELSAREAFEEMVPKPKFTTVRLAQIQACPIGSLLPSHYRADGTCKCDEEAC